MKPKRVYVEMNCIACILDTCYTNFLLFVNKSYLWPERGNVTMTKLRFEKSLAEAQIVTKYECNIKIDHVIRSNSLRGGQYMACFSAIM